MVSEPQRKLDTYGPEDLAIPEWRVIQKVGDDWAKQLGAPHWELQEESNRLLGAPIALPEGRPDEELEPVAYTPEGKPIYSEEEKARLMARAATPLAETPANPPAPTVPAAASGAGTEPVKEGRKEPTEEKLDLDF